MRRELRMGLLAGALGIVLKQFADVPELVVGMLMGLGIGLELIGILPEKPYKKLKEWKLSIANRDRA